MPVIWLPFYRCHRALYPFRKRTAFNSVSLTLIMLTVSFLAGCGPGGEIDPGPIFPIAGCTPGWEQGEGPIFPNSPTPDGSCGPGAAATATVTLAWDPVLDPSIHGYFVYYGQQSPNSFGSCSYQFSIFTSSPFATVAGLTPDTVYFFAVSAYNGLHSVCSAEVSTITKPA